MPILLLDSILIHQMKLLVLHLIPKLANPTFYLGVSKATISPHLYEIKHAREALYSGQNCERSTAEDILCN